MRQGSPEHAGRALDEVTSERLLAGAIAAEAVPPALVPVHRLLSAADAPASPDESGGEAAARALFRAARVDEVARTRVSRRVRVGAAVIVATMALGGGVAAAQTGHLPDGIQQVVRGTLSRVGVSIPDGDPEPAGTGPGGAQGGSPGTRTDPPRADGTGSGTPQTVCTLASAAKCQPDPGAPATPGDPPAPANPAAPGKPPAPANPAAPGRPPAPGNPAAPGKPATPGKPADPGRRLVP